MRRTTRSNVVGFHISGGSLPALLSLFRHNEWHRADRSEHEKGMFTVITGRVGSGKTTLLRVLLRLLPQQQSGEICWNGQRVDDAGRFLLPPRCGYTPQVPTLFSDTLRDNIVMGLPTSAEVMQEQSGSPFWRTISRRWTLDSRQ